MLEEDSREASSGVFKCQAIKLESHFCPFKGVCPFDFLIISFIDTISLFIIYNGRVCS